MTFDVYDGAEQFVALGAADALAKVQALIESGRDPFIFDHFGDPMGLVDLEEAAHDA